MKDFLLEKNNPFIKDLTGENDKIRFDMNSQILKVFHSLFRFKIVRNFVRIYFDANYIFEYSRVQRVFWIKPWLGYYSPKT